MGKPAARMTDSCSHGGLIVMGFPQVLIGGMPAARCADNHVCPMVTGVVPHVGGPILPPGGIGVLIGNMPAARMGDMAVCVGPPDVIVMGCMTVLIGEISPGGGAGGGEGGSGGGGGGSAANVAKAIAAAVAAGARALSFSFSTSSAVSSAAAAVSTAGGEAGTASNEEQEGHWIRFVFKDQAGFPVAGLPCDYERSDGRKSRTALDEDGALDDAGLPSGNCTVTLLDVMNARWSADEAKTDEPLTMTADTEGIPDGTPATITVFRRDLSGPDVQIAKYDVKVKSSKIEGEWTFGDTEEPDGDEDAEGYSKPEFFFVAAALDLDATSPTLAIKAWADVVLEDEDGNAIGDEDYRATLSTGEIRSGKLDAKGRARLEDVPAGRIEIEFPNRTPGEAATA